MPVTVTQSEALILPETGNFTPVSHFNNTIIIFLDLRVDKNSTSLKNIGKHAMCYNRMPVIFYEQFLNPVYNKIMENQTKEELIIVKRVKPDYITLK